MAYNTNDVTGSFLTTKAATDQYRDGWDRIFGAKKKAPVEHKPDHCDTCNADQVIAPNGEHQCGEQTK